MKNLFPARRRLCIFVISLLFMLLGAVVLYLFQKGWILPHALLLLLLAGVLLKLLMKQADFIPNQVNSFLRSLQNGDHTLQYPRSREPALDSMYADMNRITAFYRENLAEIEHKHRFYDRLLRIMTHELRNSVTPVITLSGDMLEHPERYTSDRLNESMKVIYGQCSGIKSFLDSYYQLSHLPAPVKTDVNIGELFNRIQTLMNCPSLHFEWGNGMTIRADADQLTLVLNNIIRNAREATAHLDEACISVRASYADGNPYIQVSDNGPGVPEEIQQDIFLPFYTTKPQGTGIGLCLCRQIMRLHGGDLKLSNHRGQGATFILAFTVV